YRHGDAAAAADGTGNATATGRGDPAAAHQKRHAVAGRAIAPGGGKHRRPGAVIDAPGICCAWQRKRSQTGDGEGSDATDKRARGEISGNHGKSPSFYYLAGTCHRTMTALSSSQGVPRFIVAKIADFCH